MSAVDGLNLPSSLVNPYVGIISNVNEIITNSPHEDNLHYFSATTGDLACCFGHTLADDNVVHCGSSTDAVRDFAALKAVVETSERYAAAIVEPFEMLSGDALTKTTCDYLSVEGLQYLSDSGTEITTYSISLSAHSHWVKGYSVTEGVSILAPVRWVHLLPDNAMVSDFFSNDSTGTAAHFDFEVAVNNAILEVIERDMVENFWLMQIQFPQIVFEQCESEVIKGLAQQDDVAFIEQRYYFCKLELALPVVIAIRRVSPPLGNFVVFGASAYPDIERAMTKARSECVAAQMAIIKGNKNAHCYSPEQLALAFLDECHSVRLSDIKAQEELFESPVETVTQFLKSRSMQLLMFNLTTDDINLVGLNVIKCIAPYFQPCNANRQLPRIINTRRSRDVRSFLKTNRIGHVSKYNPQPNPFF